MDEDDDMSKIINCGSEYVDVVKNKCINKFWTEVFESFKTLIEIEMQNNTTLPLQSPIWYNSNIKIGNKVVFYKEWYKRGIRYIADLLNKDNRDEFMNFEQFEREYKIKSNFVTYHGLINAIKTNINKQYNTCTKELNIQYPNLPPTIRIFYRNTKGSKDIYKAFIYNKTRDIPVPSSTVKWNNAFNLSSNEWKKIFKLPFNITTDSKLLWFQSRINHRILGTNWLLNKIHNTNKLCYFCKRHVETIEHLFWDCQHIKTFLDKFQHTIHNYNISDNNFNLTRIKFIFRNYLQNTLIAENSIILWIKYYIFKTKCNNHELSINGLQNYLKYNFQTIKYINATTGKLNKFYDLWNIWIPYLDQ